MILRGSWLSRIFPYFACVKLFLKMPEVSLKFLGVPFRKEQAEGPGYHFNLFAVLRLRSATGKKDFRSILHAYFRSYGLTDYSKEALRQGVPI